MTARDDGLAARALQNDEFGQVPLCGEGIYPRWAAKQPSNSHYKLPDTQEKLRTAPQSSGDKSPRHK